MTCIFQHFAVKTGLEDTHTVLVSGRQHAWWLQTTHEGQSGGLLPESASFPKGFMHVTYWSNARQHACGRKARRHTIGLHVTQVALFSQQNNSIYFIHMLCSNI
jgi:hypothetical protein